MVVLVLPAAGCRSDAERADRAREEIFAAAKSLPGVENLQVTTKAVKGGIAVDADVVLRPAEGRTAADAKALRAVLTRPEGVHGVSLTLLVRRGTTEHDGRWYDGTAGLPAFDGQVGLWGHVIDTGKYQRVVAMRQSTTRFLVTAMRWDDAGSRPAASAAYRDMVAAGTAAGLRTEDLDLTVRPTERFELGSNGTAALSDPFLAASERLAAFGVVRSLSASSGPAAPHLRIRVYPVSPLTEAQRAAMRETLSAARLLGPDLQAVEGSGAGRPL
ncbi:hypothetical protein Ato02nite_000970 [Paractinoplanes toevensis]|uniref:Uncharacterized protein n=1 Tax=Paractinoplanes toevensis TaxID=571911 RepID=A0A919T5T7_9ACTN|nr:hypothetical protein Ato02nite_000970 [Actinoplanes toevensis]